MACYVPSFKHLFRYPMFVSFWNKLSINQKLAITAWLFLAVPIVFYVCIRFYPTFEAFYVGLQTELKLNFAIIKWEKLPLHF